MDQTGLDWTGLQWTGHCTSQFGLADWALESTGVQWSPVESIWITWGRVKTSLLSISYAPSLKATRRMRRHWWQASMCLTLAGRRGTFAMEAHYLENVSQTLQISILKCGTTNHKSTACSLLVTQSFTTPRMMLMLSTGTSHQLRSIVAPQLIVQVAKSVHIIHVRSRRS